MMSKILKTVFITVFAGIVFCGYLQTNAMDRQDAPTGGQVEQCPICLNDINPKTPGRYLKMPCTKGHVLCRQCMSSWVGSGHVEKCFLCSRDFPGSFERLSREADDRDMVCLFKLTKEAIFRAKIKSFLKPSVLAKLGLSLFGFYLALKNMGKDDVLGFIEAGLSLCVSSTCANAAEADYRLSKQENIKTGLEEVEALRRPNE